MIFWKPLWATLRSRTKKTMKSSKREDGSFLCDAQIPLLQFPVSFHITHWLEEEENESFNTLAGFILYHLESIPVTGEIMDYRGFNFEIMDMDGQRIDKMLITLSDKVRKNTKKAGKKNNAADFISL